MIDLVQQRGEAPLCIKGINDPASRLELIHHGEKYRSMAVRFQYARSPEVDCLTAATSNKTY